MIFPSRKDQKKNTRKKEKEKNEEKENIEQIQYESAEHSPKYDFCWIIIYLTKNEKARCSEFLMENTENADWLERHSEQSGE